MSVCDKYMVANLPFVYREGTIGEAMDKVDSLLIPRQVFCQENDTCHYRELSPLMQAAGSGHGSRNG